MIKSSLVLLFALLPAAVALLASAPATDAELEQLRRQAVEYFTAGPPPVEAAQPHLATQNPDGSWPDIDYADKRRGHWKPSAHLTRIRRLAACYRTRAPENPLYGDPAVLEAVLRGLRFWAANAFTSDNWWHQVIGTPQDLCSIIFLLGDRMPPDLLEELRPILNRSFPGMTAQNKVWRAGIHVFKGIIYHEPSMVAEGRDQIAEEIRIAGPGEEGIQTDYSFHQHGPMLQFGNYGLSYLTEQVKWASILRDTSFAIPPEKIAIVDDYLCNGLRWVLWKGQMDFSACGRQNSRGLPAGKYRTVVGTVQRFLPCLPPERREKYDHFLELSGNRFFKKSDFLVHRRPDFYMSVKMCSRRTIGNESVNSENILGRLTGHGATFFLTDGEEYREIGAIWNWRQLPGVTAVQNSASLQAKAKNYRNESPWVGGVSDGDLGFAVMNFYNREVKARKSYFCFDRGMVVTANGIAATGKDTAPILTVVEQARLRGPVEVTDATGTRQLPMGEHRFKGALRIRHAGFEYRLDAGPDVVVRLEEVTGNWKRVTTALSPDPVTGKVLTICFDHGSRPKRTACRYTVTPVEKPAGEILPFGTELLHGEFDPAAKVAMIAFFQKGKIEVPEFGTVEAKQPSLLMIRFDGARPVLIADDPPQQQERLLFTMPDGGEVALAPAVPGNPPAGPAPANQ